MRTPHELSLRQVDFLFCPWQHRKLPLSTRVVMSTMLHSLAPGGLPTQGLAQYYYERARRSVGLILTENVSVCPCASDHPDHAEFYSGAALRLWKRVCQAVHRTSCKIAPVLWHAGELHTGGSRRRLGERVALSPSGINPITLERTGDPMTVGRMQEIIRAYAAAALHAQRLGFDAVAVNGGEMSLIDQFLRADTNKRSDEYGGDAERRSRFARELLCAVRRAVGSRFPIIFRISQTEAPRPEARLAESPLELSDLLRPLCEMGVDVFDCASPDMMQPAFEGSPLTFAGWVRLLTGRPTIAVGSEGIPDSVRRPVAGGQQGGEETECCHQGEPLQGAVSGGCGAARDVSSGGDEVGALSGGGGTAVSRGGSGGRASGVRAGSVSGPQGMSWLHALVHMLRAGEIDLLSIGHALMRDPAWASDIREARSGVRAAAGCFTGQADAGERASGGHAVG